MPKICPVADKWMLISWILARIKFLKMSARWSIQDDNINVGRVMNFLLWCIYLMNWTEPWTELNGTELIELKWVRVFIIIILTFPGNFEMHWNIGANPPRLMVCVSMGGGVVPQLWEKCHSGRFFNVFEKIFCKCASFFLPRLWGEKKSKSDFRTPLAGGPNVRYNTPPPLISGS